MINAKEEILAHIKHLGEVEYVKIALREGYLQNPRIIEGTLDKVLPLLDFNYENGYGRQELEGYIWYTDGTWSERGEYDGSEWWEYQQCPDRDIAI